MEQESVRVKVGSMSYQISAKEDPQYMREIARRADEMIKAVQKTNPAVLGPTATVLALINAVDQIEKLKEGGQGAVEAQVSLKDQLAEQQAECLHLRERCWELKKDLLYYRNLCEVYEGRLAEFPALKKGAKRKEKDSQSPLEARQRDLGELLGEQQHG